MEPKTQPSEFEALCSEAEYRLHAMEQLIARIRGGRIKLSPTERLAWRRVLTELLATLRSEWEAAAPDLLIAAYLEREMDSRDNPSED